VKISYDSSQFVYMVSSDETMCQHAIHQAGLGETPHVHRIFDRRLAIQYGLFGAAADRNDIEVEIRGKAAIYAQFLFAIKAAQFERGKIKETQVDCFLYLVCIMPGQQHPGDMRLLQRWLAWEESGCAQGIHQLLLVQQVR